MVYEVLKALHIVAVIAWMAGLLYLPRLFVYHADTPEGSSRARLSRSWSAGSSIAIMEPAQGARLDPRPAAGLAGRLVGRGLVPGEVRAGGC